MANILFESFHYSLKVMENEEYKWLTSVGVAFGFVEFGLGIAVDALRLSVVCCADLVQVRQQSRMTLSVTHEDSSIPAQYNSLSP